MGRTGTVKASRAGDADEQLRFTHLVNEHLPHLYALGRGIVGDDAEDALQGYLLLKGLRSLCELEVGNNDGGTVGGARLTGWPAPAAASTTPRAAAPPDEPDASRSGCRFWSGCPDVRRRQKGPSQQGPLGSPSNLSLG